MSACSPNSSYVQLVGQGVAAIDLGFPCRYTHSSLEVCDLADLVGLTRAPRRRGSAGSTAGFSLDRDDYPSNERTTLGIDIGTFELKGVLVDADGQGRRERRAAA